MAFQHTFWNSEQSKIISVCNSPWWWIRENSEPCLLILSKISVAGVHASAISAAGIVFKKADQSCKFLVLSWGRQFKWKLKEMASSLYAGHYTMTSYQLPARLVYSHRSPSLKIVSSWDKVVQDIDVPSTERYECLWSVSVERKTN